MHPLKGLGVVLALAASIGAGAAHAQDPADLIAAYDKAARANNPAFARFSAQAGEQFFNATHGGEWSCASCHTRNPTVSGKHAKTGKAIEPLAPAANRKRFSDAAKVEKWFKRNCSDVLNRTCTPQEKGDVLTYLLSLRP